MRIIYHCAIGCAALLAATAFQSANATTTFGLGTSNSSIAQETIVPAQMGAEGFVEVSSYYRDGPIFRLCRPQPGKSILAKDQSCVEVVSVNDGFFRGQHKEYRPIGPGLSYQEYLDHEFGDGVTEFVGLTSRFTGNKSNIVLFYRLPATAIGL